MQAGNDGGAERDSNRTDGRGTLRGKVVIVAGGAGGQGAVAAELFAREGARVMVADVDGIAASAVAGRARDGGGESDAVRLDAASATSWTDAVAAAVRKWGRLDGLANYAAILAREGVESTVPSDWDRVLQVNLTGCWYGIRAAVPAMRTSGGGSIVNVGSVDAMVGRGGATAYQASKGGVRLLTKSSSTELASEGIRINAVHPGPMENRQTPIRASDATPELAELERQLVAQVPAGRLGRPLEVAYAVRFLLSDEAPFITGVDLPVDGGLTAGFRRA